jgi:hypothetical protein
MKEKDKTRIITAEMRFMRQMAKHTWVVYRRNKGTY